MEDQPTIYPLSQIDFTLNNGATHLPTSDQITPIINEPTLNPIPDPTLALTPLLSTAAVNISGSNYFNFNLVFSFPPVWLETSDKLFS